MSDDNPGHFKPGHEIGISGRWKPGQSGNPKGRPLSKPFKQSFDRILEALSPGNPGLALDKLNAAMYAKAVNGDVAAYKELADRYEGKVPNPIGGTDELPPITAFAWRPTKAIEHIAEATAPTTDTI